MKKNIKYGFTLVELIAVIAILGLIMIIAVPKVTSHIKTNKKNAFIVNARNIIRQIEYDNIDFNSFTKIPLNDLELSEFMSDNLDANNSYAYIVDDKIFLDLKGTNEYKDFYLCNVSNTKKKVEVQDTPCDTEHNLIYIDFEVDLAGGSTSQNFNSKYLSGNYLVLQIPIKSNDTFLGWELVSGNSELDQNRIKFGTESTKIKAIWGNNPELVVNLNGGTTTQKFDSKYSGGSLILLEEPTKEGYTFKGWNLVIGNAILSGNVLTTGTTNTVIEALWEDSEYLITYNLDGGTVSVNNPSKYTIETDDIILNNPTKVGYTFTGWTGSNGNTPSKNVSILKGSTGNKTYVANYDVNTYTISYELNGGTKGTNAPTSGTYGSVVTVSNPTKTGYTFERWSISGTGSSISGTNLTIGSENITLTANWTANTNTVYVVKHWTQNLGASTTQNSTNYTVNSTENKTGTTGSSVTPSVKTIAGFTSPSTQTKTVSADGSLVINYYYTRNSYTYTLGSKTGASTTGSTSSGSYQYGATITLKASAKTGYTWSNWTSSNTNLVGNKTTANTTFTMPAGNITMTPNVTANTYTISYTLNGGTKGSKAPTSGTYGSTVEVSNPTRSNYTFTGWTVSGTGASMSETNLTIGAGNITLTANWKADKLYLYNNGDQNTTITGGWNNSSFTKMYAATSSADDSSIVPKRYTLKKIDLTPYNTLKFVYADHSWGGTQGRFYVSSNQSTSGNVVSGVTGQNTSGTVTLDISSVTGSYYIYFELSPYYNNGGYLTITQVILE